MKAPTSEECSANAEVTDQQLLGADAKGARVFALWAPQLEGYTAKALVELGDSSECFELFVFHDGEFPNDHAVPMHLHGCSVEQVVRFADTMKEIAARAAKTPP